MSNLYSALIGLSSDIVRDLLNVLNSIEKSLQAYLFKLHKFL